MGLLRRGRGGIDAAGTAYVEAFRGMVLAALACRGLAMLPGIALVFVGYGPNWLGLAALALWAANALTALGVRGAIRFTVPEVAPLLLVDLAVGLGTTLLAGLLLSPTTTGRLQDVLVPFVAGSVVLNTAAWGLAAGAGVVLAALPVEFVAARQGTDLLWWLTGLVASLVVAGLGLVVLARQTRAAAWSGARSERDRMLRLLHDTVLQSLEAMSLRSTVDGEDPARALAEVRATARAEAARLRRLLRTPDADRGGLVEELGEVVDEVVARGLRVELVMADLGPANLTRPRREALAGAVRAALGNVLRHSGQQRALVRVEPAQAGVRVVVRDHGHGFTPEADRYGFGLRESVLARVGEVGGTASVESTPGAGTRVVLWVPV